jgi:hypothetical protein
LDDEDDSNEPEPGGKGTGRHLRSNKQSTTKKNTSSTTTSNNNKKNNNNNNNQKTAPAIPVTPKPSHNITHPNQTLPGNKSASIVKHNKTTLDNTVTTAAGLKVTPMKRKYGASYNSGYRSSFLNEDDDWMDDN